MFNRAIEILENHNRIFAENVDEWLRVPDEFGMNRTRAEKLRADIEENEQAIECLKKQAVLQETLNRMNAEVLGKLDERK